MKKNYKSFSLIETVKSLGIAKETLNCVGECFILHFGLKDQSLETYTFANADDCFNAFQDICLIYGNIRHSDKSMFVDFPNEFSDGHNEDLGTMIIVGKDNQIEDVYELVNPEYYE